MTWRRSTATGSPSSASIELVRCLAVHRRRLTDLVFVILVQFDTRTLRFSPVLGHAVVDIGLMYYFRNQPGHVVDEGRIGSGNFRAVNGVGRAIFDQEGEEGEDTANEEGNDQEVDGEEDGETTTHDWRGGGGHGQEARGGSRRRPDWLVTLLAESARGGDEGIREDDEQPMARAFYAPHVGAACVVVASQRRRVRRGSTLTMRQEIEIKNGGY